MFDEKGLAQLRNVIEASQQLCAQTDVQGMIITFAVSALSLSQACRARVVRKEGNSLVVEYDIELIGGQPLKNKRAQFLSPDDPLALCFDFTSCSASFLIQHGLTSAADLSGTSNVGANPTDVSLCLPLACGKQDPEILYLERPAGAPPFDSQLIGYLML